LIGDGASTLPFDLNSNSTLIQCTTKDLFQSGSDDKFFISTLEAVDVGRVGDVFRSENTFNIMFFFLSYFIYNFAVIVKINYHIIVKVLK
jgi:hypothetical protein